MTAASTFAEVVSAARDPSTFVYQRDITWWSSFSHIYTAWAVYIVVVFGGQWLMKNREAYKLKHITAIHNAFLCLWSLAMCAGIVYYGPYTWLTTGNWFHLWCPRGQQPSRNGFEYWMYIYYISKYYELLDTVIMVLKKKTLIVLHVYHHLIVVFLSWTWLGARWDLVWWGIFLNTFVHVFMYYYYAVSNYGVRVWWKKYITTFQLFQFFTVFFTIWVWCYLALRASDLRITSVYPFVTAVTQSCDGDVHVIAFSQFVNITFLVLFANFFFQTYVKKPAAATAGGKKKKNA